MFPIIISILGVFNHRIYESLISHIDQSAVIMNNIFIYEIVDYLNIFIGHRTNVYNLEMITRRIPELIQRNNLETLAEKYYHEKYDIILYHNLILRIIMLRGFMSFYIKYSV